MYRSSPKHKQMPSSQVTENKKRAGGGSGDEKEGAKMGLRLQLENGEIKEYKTARGVGAAIGGEVSECDKWITGCGREWDKVPESYQECDHLECAIRAAVTWQLNVIFGIFFAAIAAISFGIRTMGPPKDIIIAATLFSLAFAVMATILLVLGFVEKGLWDELNEFKNNGTIKGIKAWKISEDTHTR
jgi:hypothetical protein